MGFEERIKLAKNMEKSVINFLKSKGFILENTGYEKYSSNEIKEKIRTIHNNLTVRFMRYMPDYFAILGNNIFFIELKVMDTPIRLDSRVNELIEITGITDLSKENIGAVETAALNNYEQLTSIGVKIAVIVLCTFNKKLLFMEWENNLVKFYNNKVKIGQGNASFTPYTNIHVDKLRTFEEFLNQELSIEVKSEESTKIKQSILN